MVVDGGRADRDRNLLEKFSSAAAASAQNEQIPAKKALPERICFIHEGIEGLFYCSNCNVWRCKECAHVYNGVAVCPDCDSLSIHADKLQEQATKEKEIARPFSWELKRALTFPFRHYVFTITVWLLVWVVAAVADSASDIISSPPLKEIFLGPMVGRVGKFLAFSLLGCISTACLIARSDGREGWEISKIDDYSVIIEPIGFWASAAMIGLFPLILYLGFHEFQIVVVGVITGNDYSSKLRPGSSLFRYLVIFALSLWALFFYPMGLVVAAARRSVLPVLNPLTAISAWIALKEWLKPAFAIVVALNLITFVVIMFANFKYGLAVSSAFATLDLLICVQAVGAAIHKGSDKLEFG
jgi:hypothetical protein